MDLPAEIRPLVVGYARVLLHLPHFALSGPTSCEMRVHPVKVLVQQVRGALLEALLERPLDIANRAVVVFLDGLFDEADGDVPAEMAAELKGLGLL